MVVFVGGFEKLRGVEYGVGEEIRGREYGVKCGERCVGGVELFKDIFVYVDWVFVWGEGGDVDGVLVWTRVVAVGVGVGVGYGVGRRVV